MSYDFSGKAVIVTGATSGIGAACARRFGAAGASLFLTGRDYGRGRLLTDELGGAAEFRAGDVRDAAFCGALVGDCVDTFGRLDVLVNSAGVWHVATAAETSDEVWNETMATNVSGLFYMSRAAIRVMSAAGAGNIVNIASDWGLVGGRRAAAYCASKGAVVQLTRAMALDHAEDNVRINALCPTDTDTPMMHREFEASGVDVDEGLAKCAAANPMGRIATAEDVAAAACFIASDDAAFITGAAIPIDGGTTAG